MTWNANPEMMPPTRYAPRRSLASRAASSDRKITNRYSPSAVSTPMNPCSSARTEKGPRAGPWVALGGNFPRVGGGRAGRTRENRQQPEAQAGEERHADEHRE